MAEREGFVPMPAVDTTYHIGSTESRISRVPTFEGFSVLNRVQASIEMDSVGADFVQETAYRTAVGYFSLRAVLKPKREAGFQLIEAENMS